MSSDEDAFKVWVIEFLHLHNFLVYHPLPGRDKHGNVTTRGQGDPEGYFDVTAMRPHCPVLFLELKDKAAVTANQKDWQEAGFGDGRFCTVLRPRNRTAFEEHIKILNEMYPIPDGWRTTLSTRKERIARNRVQRRKRKGDEVIQRAMGVRSNNVVTLKPGHPAVFKSGKSVYKYKGHGNHDNSITGFGPVIWSGKDGKWLPTKAAKFKTFPEGALIHLEWKDKPDA